MATIFGAKTTGVEIVQAHPEAVEGKIIVITGPSLNGIGAETALAFAHGNPKHLILAGRNETKIAPVIEQIRSISPKTAVSFVHLDLADMSSVRTAAQEISDLEQKIDILVNNAGIMAVQEYTTTVDGIESQFGANHVGHFLLTKLLMPRILGSPTARVINVSSMGHELGTIRFENWNFDDGKTYHPWLAYGQSKMANVLFARGLAKRMHGRPSFRAYSLHPGLVLGTNLQAGVPLESFASAVELTKQIKKNDNFEMEEPKSNAEGAGTVVAASLLDGDNGGFWKDCVVFETNEYSRDPENADKLWALSEKLVGEDFVCGA